MTKDIAILCAGETLIDFIGTQTEAPLSETKDYHRYLGGSPTNVAMNMARLGASVEMVATVGDDGFGQYIVGRLEEAGVGQRHLKTCKHLPSTTIFINQTEHTPEFIAYRGADAEITEDQFPDKLLERVKIFHTTCFALSRQPARDTIVKKAKKASELGALLSIDVNFSEKIWPDKKGAQDTLAEYCKYGALVKISQDDVDRLLGPGISHEAVFSYLHGLGASKICFTLGKDGAKLSQMGATVLEVSAFEVEKIMDATGAGDAFWSGFLFAYLKDKSPQKCLESALKMAAIKLQNVGRIPDYANVIADIMNQ